MTGPAGGRPPPGAPQPWRVLLALYSITSLVESLGVSQIFAFMLLRLRSMGVSGHEASTLVGLLSPLVFVLGLPIVPLWGVWADKHSRKVVIVRSAVVEAVVFGAVALSRTPLELAGALLLVGFQLGNTGVMIAALRDVVPPHRLGTAVSVFGASSSVGFAIGPLLGALMVRVLHTSLDAVYWTSAALSVGVALMLSFGSREVRPEVVPEGRAWDLALRAVRGVFTSSSTRLLFAAYGALLLARQMLGPYLPLLAVRAAGHGGSAVLAIGIVTGVSALAGALVSPAAGALGDRIGFRPVLVASLALGAVAVATMPLAGSVAILAPVAAVVAALGVAAASMVTALLARETPPERRSATLNLVLLPLYVGGIVGPAIGAGVVQVGLPWVFVVAAALMAGGIAPGTARPGPVDGRAVPAEGASGAPGGRR